MKKRILAVLAAFSICFTGCSASDDSLENKESSVSSQETPVNVNAQDVPVTEISDLDNTLHSFGQGKHFNEENIPTDCIEYQEEYGKYNATFVKEDSENKIYLTFDEGYENGHTAEILDVLKEKNVPAVFFITGDYLDRSPELVQRMIDEGHSVGNHTENHPSMPSLSVEETVSEINTLGQRVEEEFGYQMNLFRPPKGEFSERSLAITEEQGYETVFWSFAYADWDPDNQPDTDYALNILTERLHPGAIYLLHAVSSVNAEILGDWIDNARADGYEFALLP